MKRAGNLIHRIAEANNLRRAFLKARRGKQTRPDVRRFAENLDDELDDLRRELDSGPVDWGGYHTFQIHDPKERTIHAPAFRARVAHHAIMNPCEPAFEAYQIADSYACRKKRGLDPALKRALAFCRDGGIHLKMDVRKYFDTIDHDVLKGQIRRRFKDGRVIELFESVIDTYGTAPGKGVPIGNLTSQFFANHYLAPFDRHVKESLRVRRYVRYMDDFVVWADDRRTIKDLRREMETFLADRLNLTVKPPCQNSVDRGMTFLGYKLHPRGLRLSARSRQRFRRKARIYHTLFEAGLWDERTAAMHMEPLIAFVDRAESRAFRRRVFTAPPFSPGRRPEARTG